MGDLTIGEAFVFFFLFSFFIFNFFDFLTPALNDACLVLRTVGGCLLFLHGWENGRILSSDMTVCDEMMEE